MSGETRRTALLTLRHCGVIRVTLGRVPAGYVALQREHLLRTRQVRSDPDKVDCRLNEAGEREARQCT